MSFLDEKNDRLLVDLLLVVAVVGLLVGAALRFAGRTDLEGIFIQTPVFFSKQIYIIGILAFLEPDVVKTTGLWWWTKGRSVRGVVNLREEGSATRQEFDHGFLMILI